MLHSRKLQKISNILRLFPDKDYSQKINETCGVFRQAILFTKVQVRLENEKVTIVMKEKSKGLKVRSQDEMKKWKYFS